MWSPEVAESTRWSTLVWGGARGACEGVSCGRFTTLESTRWSTFFGGSVETLARGKDRVVRAVARCILCEVDDTNETARRWGMANPAKKYHVQGRSESGVGAAILAGGHTIPIDASWGADEASGLPGPAELLASAFAACILKNLERSSAMMPFQVWLRFERRRYVARYRDAPRQSHLRSWGRRSSCLPRRGEIGVDRCCARRRVTRCLRLYRLRPT